MKPGPFTSIYFSDIFDVDPDVLRDYGAFDVSLVNDLPLFIDPFLLFNSDRPEYQALHDEIIRYVVFLRERAEDGTVAKGLLANWFTFKEVKETWLGFSKSGNRGRGLGPDFATALHANLGKIFASFGTEQVTKGSHIEKLCLISDKVGRDGISDFTTNLIKPYLIEFTERFAKLHLRDDQCRDIRVAKARFNYDTASWSPTTSRLPYADRGYVLLTPLDMLTKDDVWINRNDMVKDYENVVSSVTNLQLRDQLTHYFHQRLEEVQRRDDEKRKARAEAKGKKSRHDVLEAREPTASQQDEAASATIRQFPEVIDEYIRHKEENGDEAEARADERVRSSERLFVGQVRSIINILTEQTTFYAHAADTLDGALQRATVLKDVVETGSAREFLFYDGEAVQNETDLHIMMRLVWCNDPTAQSEPLAERRRPSFSKNIVQVKSAANPRIASFFAKPVSDLASLPVRIVICFSRLQRGNIAALRDALPEAERARIVVVNASA